MLKFAIAFFLIALALYISRLDRFSPEESLDEFLENRNLEMTQSGNITNIEAEGSLEPSMPESCIELDQVTNMHTPADLYPAMADCISKNEYQKAFRLFPVIRLYGAYDQQRVTDVSAHQATTVLRIETFAAIEESNMAEFQVVYERIATEETDKLQEICTAIRAIGPPNYYPSYMIQHGLGAITGSSNSPIKEIEEADYWESSVSRYLSC